MTGRVILAGVAAAIAMFIWASIAHVATPLGHIGFSKFTNEQAVLDTLKTGSGDHGGLFISPYAETSAEMSKLPPEGPFALVVYHPNVKMGMNPAQLGGEFVIELVEMLILAFLISWAKIGSLWCRVGFAAAAGVMAVITTNMSYHIWYGFPASYTMAYMAIEFIGYVVGGLAIAFILPKPAAPMAA